MVVVSFLSTTEPDPVIYLDPAGVAAYLNHQGWKRVLTPHSSVAIFHREKQGRAHVTVPMDKSLGDYVELMREAITRLTDIEGRKFDQVYLDLARPASDTLRIQLSEHATDDGTVPLLDGIRFLDAGKTALLAIACSIADPKTRHHSRMSHTQAERFLAVCRLGQTERGSFVATYVCPVVVNPNEEPQTEYTPMFDKYERTTAAGHMAFGRQVCTRLVRSVDFIRNVLTDRGVDELVGTDDEIRPTANLLDSLAQILPEDPAGSVTIQCHWAPILPMTKRQHIPASVSLSAKHRDHLFQASERLKKVLPVRSGDRHQGRVSALQGAVNDEGRVCGRIDLAVGRKKVRVNLSPEDYALAAEAHLTNRPVTVFGTLSRIQKVSSIEDYQGFEILS